MTSVEAQIRDRVQQFVEELTGLVRSAAMEAVGAALGNGSSAAPARRGSPPVRNPSAGKPATGKKRGRPRTREVVDGARVLAAISANPGVGVTEIAAGMGVSSDAVKPTVAELLAGGQIRKTGERRGTRYHPAGRAGGGEGAAGGGARKAAGKKGRRRKKAAGRKTTSKSAA